ncbi:hypothetical protein J2X20_005295 [Pelomonas saccharophila]|uniref:Phosphatidate cytidylyltransferase n=1 Tax=Roseateles saccharophilus TaxID=304 RepID=A0ABU1YUT0_ROSSA|nr:hypothetical protein [Roseateles saccharophilus]MDR7272612.1 hypothetical protein [Roseateles saccharophilus]
MKHPLVTALLLVAALACYGFGLGGDIALLLALGAVFELGFWARAVPGFGLLSRKREQRAESASTGHPG